MTRAKPGSTAALSAAPLDETFDFPDDSDGRSPPTGGELKALANPGDFQMRLHYCTSRISYCIYLSKKAINMITRALFRSDDNISRAPRCI